MTVEEFCEYANRPENVDRILELIRGDVVEWTRPYVKHGVVCANLTREVGEYTRRVPGYYPTCNNAGVILQRNPDTVVGPDIAVFEAAAADDPITGWGTDPPLLAVEVLNPTDDLAIHSVKVEDYLRNGVRLVWVVNYETKTATVYRPGQSPVAFTMYDELTGGEELPGFTCKVADLFRLPGDRSAQQPQPPAA